LPFFHLRLVLTHGCAGTAYQILYGRTMRFLFQPAQCRRQSVVFQRFCVGYFFIQPVADIRWTILANTSESMMVSQDRKIDLGRVSLPVVFAKSIAAMIRSSDTAGHAASKDSSTFTACRVDLENKLSPVGRGMKFDEISAGYVRL
jgi:hypothetical protein